MPERVARDYQGRQWNAAQFADAAKRSGYDGVAIQLYRVDGGTYMSELRARGLSAGLWDAYPSDSRAKLALSYSPDFYVVQAETGQGAAAENAVTLARAIAPEMPLAIVTNMEPSRTIAGFDATMHANGVSIMPEAYPDNTPWQGHLDQLAAALYSECEQRGYRSVYVVPGLFNGTKLSAYGLGATPFAAYLAEDATAEDLA